MILSFFHPATLSLLSHSHPSVYLHVQVHGFEHLEVMFAGDYRTFRWHGPVGSSGMVITHYFEPQFLYFLVCGEANKHPEALTTITAGSSHAMPSPPRWTVPSKAHSQTLPP